MSFNGFYTQKGLVLAAKVAGGEKLTITKAVAGSGTTAASASALADIKQTLTVGTARVDGQTATLPVTLAEAGASASYTLKELGVYATDPDEGEILFQVFRLNEGHAITAGGDSIFRFYLRETVGTNGVTVACSLDGLLVEADLEPLYASITAKPDALLAETVLHVSKSGNDTTGDGSETKPYLTLQKAVDSLPKLLMREVTITIHAGTYEEHVMVHDFAGTATLIIKGAESNAVKLKTMDIQRCTNSLIYLIDLEFTGVSTDEFKWSLNCEHVTAGVRVFNAKCTNTVSSSTYGAMHFGFASRVQLYKTTVSNKAIALDVCASTLYLSSSVTGSNNTVGIRCGSNWGTAGGFVVTGGATISGSHQKAHGGQIW